MATLFCFNSKIMNLGRKKKQPKKKHIPVRTIAGAVRSQHQWRTAGTDRMDYTDFKYITGCLHIRFTNRKSKEGI